MQLAVFDLDGTITRRDTLAQYVFGYLRRHPWRFIGLPLVLPALIGFALKRRDHGQLKAAFIRSTLRGCSREQLEAWNAQFVPALLARGVFADAIARIAAHREAGDRLVLMSASVDFYVPAIGQALGFAQTLCTGVLWKGNFLDGALTTPNRRGVEKVHCFEALRQAHPGLKTAAYGNAGSDLPHLRLADHGVLVNGDPAARREASAAGVSNVDWK
jgi:HAD superfamily hydrolase (TIGR01490 family)